MKITGEKITATPEAFAGTLVDLAKLTDEIQPLQHVTAALSMLHEPTGRCDSATRLFRGKPVLWWTLQRLSRSSRIESAAVLCWEDQLPAVHPIADEAGICVLAKGPRGVVPQIDAVAAAARWSDGWRGGLLGVCAFDRGFYAPWFWEIAQRLESQALLLIDPAAGLIDMALLDATIAHAERKPTQDFFFSPAAPGLSGPLIRAPLLQQLTQSQSHVGRYLTYLPDHPGSDPIGGDACAPVNTRLARTTRRFTMDSDRQVQRIERHTESLNGQLIGSPAESLLDRFERDPQPDALPRDITLELNTTRHTSPIFWPGAGIHRQPLPADAWEKTIRAIGEYDDTRLTIAGIGDPLLSDDFLRLLSMAQSAGIKAIHVETDLLQLQPEQLIALAEAPIDVLSMHIPATSPGTYRAVMGVEGLMEVVSNLKSLLEHRQTRRRGLPIIVPTFVKCRQNLQEMEAWYDQWLRALGSAVIRGPSDFAGQHADCAVADMSPSARIPCRRLQQRMHLLCDGSIVACEQDIHGKHAIGNVQQMSIADAWSSGLESLRKQHAAGQWNQSPLCASCREWHRP